MQAKTGVLLVNLGTPDSPKTKDVRSYLFQFLNDKRVIDIPWLLRKILVNGIIVPFRAPKSAKVYKELWTEQGSPIIYHTHNLCHKLKSILGSEFHVEYAMRYKNPSLKKILSSWEGKNFKQIIIILLFPQYASATNGSVIEQAMNVMKKSGGLSQKSPSPHNSLIMSYILRHLRRKEINITLVIMTMYFLAFMDYPKDM